MPNIGVPTSAFRLQLSDSSSRTTTWSTTRISSRKMSGNIPIRTGRQLLLIRSPRSPVDFRVKAVQMRDWEAMSRASLGILNHLDWFMSSVWPVLDECPIEKDRQADIDKLMSASGIAVNQRAHGQQCDSPSGSDSGVFGSQ